MFTSLLPPNSDHVMIHLGGYNCAICYAQLRAWGYVQTEQLYPPKWIITWSELGGNKDVNTLAEYVYWYLHLKECTLKKLTFFYKMNINSSTRGFHITLWPRSSTTSPTKLVLLACLVGWLFWRELLSQCINIRQRWTCKIKETFGQQEHRSPSVPSVFCSVK